MMDFKIHLFINPQKMHQLKKDKGTDNVLIWKSKGTYSSNHYKLLSYITEQFLDIKWESNLIKILQL